MDVKKGMNERPRRARRAFRTHDVSKPGAEVIRGKSKRFVPGVSTASQVVGLAMPD